YRFKTSFTDGLCGVHGPALTVGYVSETMPYFASCVCFVDKPWTVGKSTCICSHAFYFVTMKASVCISEKKNGWHAHYACRITQQQQTENKQPNTTPTHPTPRLYIPGGDLGVLHSLHGSSLTLGLAHNM